MIIRDIYHSLLKHKWELGFVTTPLKSILEGEKSVDVKWIKHNYKDRWFADPFILSYDDNIVILLVEELLYSTNRGRIAELVINRKENRIVSNKTILDLDTHLSFPAIRRIGNEIYIYPENYASGSLAIYRYDLTSHQLLERKIISNEKLTDAIETSLFNRPLIFSTKVPDPNGNILGIYTIKNGLYELESTFCFKENIARNAGDLFEYEDKIYRPAQECNYRYGHAISIQEVSETPNGNFTFKEVNRIYSPNKRLNHGCHTFNVFGDLIVFDAHGFRHYYLASFLMWLRKVILKK